MIHHRKTDALSADDLKRVEWCWKCTKGRISVPREDYVTVPFFDPPDLQEPPERIDFDTVPNWNIIETACMRLSGEAIGYRHQGQIWEWVNVYLEFKDVKICVDSWRYDSIDPHHRETNQF